jgi:pSer/pThr/pTyr-binding forkhead associated (FHA) protein
VAAVRLVVVAGTGAGRVFELSGSTVIGRDPSVGIVLDDMQVSRRHAAVSLDVQADAVVVEDLGSMNGTWIDGVRIDGPRSMSPGQKVRVGETVLRLQSQDSEPGLSRDTADALG